jgi:UDP-2-acetamido-2-deoxy-ribo-hexuluronate aminotransferase
METIKMVDLYGQYNRYRDEINGAIQEVIDSTAFIKGPEVKEFERELARYLGIKHVISCANGTDALQLALMALKLEPGDEVITTPFSFIASIEVIRLLRLVPVLVDIRPDTFNIDDNLIEKAISKNTRAIMPVHLFGQCARMENIMKIARKHKLVVIEDNAQSLGTDYFFSNGSVKKAGTIGQMGCTSFFPSKTLGAYGDAGAVFTNDDSLAEMLWSMANHGQEKKYYYNHVGINSRLDSIQAAILRVKLKYLDEFIQARIKAADTYDRLLEPCRHVKSPLRVDYSSHSFHQYSIELFGVNRNELRKYLADKGIPTMVYYPLSLHLQKAYRDLNYKSGDFPVSEQLSNNVLSLPIHTELTSEQLKFIAGHLIQFTENN